MSLGPPEVILCLFVALLVLGPEQLPKTARNIGRALREFRKFNAAMQHQVNDFIKLEDEGMKPQSATIVEQPPSTTTRPQAPPPDPATFKQVDDVLNTVPISPPSEEDPAASSAVLPARPSEQPE